MSDISGIPYDAYYKACDAYAAARAEEMRIEDERPIAKHEAIMRVMQTPNELTGKAHSASSAETQVEMDPGYRDYLAQRRASVVNTIKARAERDVALVSLQMCAKIMQEAA